MILSAAEKQDFQNIVWQYYRSSGRHDLPWRQPDEHGQFDPYYILVSELMLQQTQVSRVIPKYLAFLQRFPTVQSLASAPLGDVLRAWQGLGYNRRAKFLWQAAQLIAEQGWPTDLTTLPGVGVNTAGAIRAYAWNEPAIFIETNIRTVYIHHFAPDQLGISDAYIRDLLTQTLMGVSQGKRAAGQNVNHFVRAVRKNVGLSHEPRLFYWALMDYGSYLKTQVRNLSQSAHYAKQSKFAGSERQLRGQIIRELAERPLTRVALAQRCNDDRLDMVLEKLLAEGLIVKSARGFRLA